MYTHLVYIRTRMVCFYDGNIQGRCIKKYMTSNNGRLANPERVVKLYVDREGGRCGTLWKIRQT